jgi:AcrR family transcriptional regulator
VRGRRYHHGGLREALVKCALEIVSEKGPEGLGLRAVARKAGVSHMAPYHHFADRESLVAAVAEEGFRRMRASVVRHIRRFEGNPLRQFQESAVAYVTFALRNGSLYRVMFGPEAADKTRHPDLRDAAAAAYGLIGGGAARSEAAGLIEWREGETAAAVIWAMLHGLSMLLLDGQLGPDVTRRRGVALARAATELLFAGLQPRRAAG